jgi:hypothetical protein
MQTKRRARWVAEFIMIVVGVLSAFAVNDWSEERADRNLEIHYLTGIRNDLERDTADSMGAIRAAQGRAAATDELLRLAGDAQAGHIPPMDRNLDQRLSETHVRYRVGTLSVQDALVMAGDQRRLDLSTSHFNEAVSSGRLTKIRDTPLRSVILTHYGNARRYERADERGEAIGLQFRAVLAAAGFAPGDTDVRALQAALRQDRELLAAVKNLREFALRQVSMQMEFMASAKNVLVAIDDWLREHDAKR